MGSSGRRTHPVMPARPREAPMTLRNPRRETESTHSEAPLGNSRCRASLNSSVPASSSRERQYSGPVFSAASWAVAASMRSRTRFRSSRFEGQTSSRVLIWIRPPVFFSSFVMRVNRCAVPAGLVPIFLDLPQDLSPGLNYSVPMGRASGALPSQRWQVLQVVMSLTLRTLYFFTRAVPRSV
jgi:hypothetical protein